MDKKLKLVKEKIDSILDNNALDGFIWEEGSGRVVVIIDEFAVKLPWTHEENCDEDMSGESQNKKEYEIYTNTKHSRLVPSYELYRGCLISKAVADMSELCRCGFRKTNTIEDVDYGIQEGLVELKDVIEKYKLDSDIERRCNWGYDFKLNKYVCLDYGI